MDPSLFLEVLGWKFRSRQYLRTREQIVPSAISRRVGYYGSGHEFRPAGRADCAPWAFFRSTHGKASAKYTRIIPQQRAQRQDLPHHLPDERREALGQDQELR